MNLNVVLVLKTAYGVEQVIRNAQSVMKDIFWKMMIKFVIPAKMAVWHALIPIKIVNPVIWLNIFILKLLNAYSVTSEKTITFMKVYSVYSAISMTNII